MFAAAERVGFEEDVSEDEEVVDDEGIGLRARRRRGRRRMGRIRGSVTTKSRHTSPLELHV